MSSLICFEKINKDWSYSNSTYEIMFTGIFELYMDKSKTPDICDHLRKEICRNLYDCWPEKYPVANGQLDGVLTFTDYPVSQQLELLRASQAMLTDLIADRVDRRLQMHPEARPYFIKVLDEFITLMREELAAP
jgi:hypothetical protein